MTHDEALDALADHPHGWRYRQLCVDHPDRESYRALVVRLATGAPPDPAPVRVEYGANLPRTPCCGGTPP